VRYARAFLSRLWAVLRSRQMDRDIDDEIAGHFAEARDEYIQRGLSPEDAHWAALRSFGGVTQGKEVYRKMRSFM
jgi:macrolide transport system ATP-binding/permease protein